jgi:xanthine dehydrogenase/oxidase
MVVTGGRHPFLARWRVGAGADGRLTAADVAVYSNGGCSPDLSAPVMQRALLHAANAYAVPALRAVGTVCRTNLPSNTAFRGFGAPQAMLAFEAALDGVAAALAARGGGGFGGGRDARLAVREANLVAAGDANSHYGAPLPPDETHARACWDGVVASSDVEARLAAAAAFNAAHRWRKRGVAAAPTMFGASFTHKPYNQAGALVHIVAADGSVRVSHGGVEMGQGLHTKVIAVAAAALDVPPASILIVDTSTDAVANASPTAASVSSDLYGGAVAAACAALAARLAPFRTAHPASFPAAVAAAYAARVDLTAHGFYATPGVDGYGTSTPFAYNCFGAAVAEVELDVLTGAHTLLRADVVMDVGAPLNPALDVGQVEGAFVQGAGWVTTEDVVRGDGDHAWLPRGVTHTRGPGAYKLPSAADAPADFRVTLLRGVRCGATPLTHASKAVGEPPFFLGATVFFALRAAVAAARAHLGLDGDFTLHSPATAEALRLACGGDACAAAAGVGREGVAVRPSC